MTDTSESDTSGCESSGESEKKDEPMSMDEGMFIRHFVFGQIL